MHESDEIMKTPLRLPYPAAVVLFLLLLSDPAGAEPAIETGYSSDGGSFVTAVEQNLFVYPADFHLLPAVIDYLRAENRQREAERVFFSVLSYNCGRLREGSGLYHDCLNGKKLAAGIREKTGAELSHSPRFTLQKYLQYYAVADRKCGIQVAFKTRPELKFIRFERHEKNAPVPYWAYRLENGSAGRVYAEINADYREQQILDIWRRRFSLPADKAAGELPPGQNGISGRHDQQVSFYRRKQYIYTAFKQRSCSVFMIGLESLPQIELSRR